MNNVRPWRVFLAATGASVVVFLLTSGLLVQGLSDITAAGPDSDPTMTSTPLSNSGVSVSQQMTQVDADIARSSESLAQATKDLQEANNK